MCPARRAWNFVLVLAMGSAPSCAQHIPPPSTPTPAMDRPAAAIPADLDVAIRLDLDAARRLFGPSVGHALQLDIADPAEDPKTAALVSDALAHAEVVWVAFRPGLTSTLTDNVLALRGSFASIDPPLEGDGAWRTPTDLGAGFRLYERRAPKRRSAPSRLYARADEWLVFVSEAEVDSAERSIELRAGDEHLDPKERGIVSLAARVPPLVPLLTEKFPSVAEALSSAVRIEGVADADDRGLRAALEIRYETDAAATDGRTRLVPLLGALQRVEGALGRLARGAVATVTGAVLVLDINLDGAGLAALVKCFDHDPMDGHSSPGGGC